MYRIRRDAVANGIVHEVRFEPLRFGGNENPHYRAEIKVGTLDAGRNLERRGLLAGLCMAGTPLGKKRQRSIIGPQNIINFEED